MLHDWAGRTGRTPHQCQATAVVPSPWGLRNVEYRRRRTTKGRNRLREKKVLKESRQLVMGTTLVHAESQACIKLIVLYMVLLMGMDGAAEHKLSSMTLNKE
jgi:hypothetical protein